MNLEEKRELRLQISQILADAGLNQGTLKGMVIDTINAKVDRAVDQCFKRLNAETSSGDFISEYVHKQINHTFWTERAIKEAVLDAIKNKVVRVVLTDCEFERNARDKRTETNACDKEKKYDTPRTVLPKESVC